MIRKRAISALSNVAIGFSAALRNKNVLCNNCYYQIRCRKYCKNQQVKTVGWFSGSFVRTNVAPLKNIGRGLSTVVRKVYPAPPLPIPSFSNAASAAQENLSDEKSESAAPVSSAAAGASSIRGSQDYISAVLNRQKNANQLQQQKNSARKFADKLRQLFPGKFLTAEPAFKASPEKTEACREICAMRIRELKTLNADNIDIVKLAEAVAYSVEEQEIWRKPGRSKQSGDEASEPLKSAIFPELKSADQAKVEAIRAFLEAVQFDKLGRTPAELKESWGNADSGYMHQLPSVAGQTGLAVLAVAQSADPTGIAGYAIPTVRFVLQGVQAIAVDSIWTGLRRMRYKNSEEIMPLGYAKPTPQSEKVPDTFQCSKDMIGFTDKFLPAYEQLKALDNDQSSYAELKSKLEETSKLHSIRVNYKVSSRTADIEWQGARRQFAHRMVTRVGYGIGVALVPVTGPLGLLGAVCINNLINLRFHFSKAGKYDSQDKLSASVMAVLKSNDLIMHSTNLKDYEPGEKNYQQRKMIHAQIADRYGKYLEQIRQPDADVEKATAQLREDLKEHFNLKMVNKIWQLPVGTRLGIGDKLLRGKLARAYDDLSLICASLELMMKKNPELEIELNTALAQDSDLQANAGDQTPDGQALKKAKLVLERAQATLLDIEQLKHDCFNLKLATIKLEQTIAKGVDQNLDKAHEKKLFKDSSALLEKIQDKDFFALFNGDADTQIRISHKAKRKEFGQTTKYIATAGINAVPGNLLSEAVIGYGGIQTYTGGGENLAGDITEGYQVDRLAQLLVSLPGGPVNAHTTAGYRVVFPSNYHLDPVYYGKLQHCASQASKLNDLAETEQADDIRESTVEFDLNRKNQLSTILEIGKAGVPELLVSNNSESENQEIKVSLKEFSAFHHSHQRANPELRRTIRNKQVKVIWRLLGVVSVGLLMQYNSRRHMRKTRVEGREFEENYVHYAELLEKKRIAEGVEISSSGDNLVRPSESANSVHSCDSSDTGIPTKNSENLGNTLARDEDSMPAGTSVATETTLQTPRAGMPATLDSRIEATLATARRQFPNLGPQIAQLSSQIKSTLTAAQAQIGESKLEYERVCSAGERLKIQIDDWYTREQLIRCLVKGEPIPPSLWNQPLTQALRGDGARGAQQLAASNAQRLDAELSKLIRAQTQSSGVDHPSLRRLHQQRPLSSLQSSALLKGLEQLRSETKTFINAYLEESRNYQQRGTQQLKTAQSALNKFEQAMALKPYTPVSGQALGACKESLRVLLVEQRLQWAWEMQPLFEQRRRLWTDIRASGDKGWSQLKQNWLPESVTNPLQALDA